MVIRNLFELDSVKDQLALLKMLTSHIDLERYMGGIPESHESDYKILLEKMETVTKNLKTKKEDLENLLNN